jgi:Na+-translocating ferredoxin:NAD+ oxidoreductase subunit E
MRGLARTANIKQEDEYYYDERLHETSAKNVFRNGLLLNNPVLFNAFGVTILIGACDTLSKALVISAMTFVLMLVTELLASLFYKDLDTPLRMSAYVLTAAVLLALIAPPIFNRYPALVSSLGIYLPLVCITGLITVRCETFASVNKAGIAAMDAIGCSCGFAAVAILFGVLREFIASNSFAGIIIGKGHTFSAASMAFFAFLMLGLLAALAQRLRRLWLRRRQAELDDAVGGDKL